MSEAQSGQRCTCLYCGESFSLKKVKWRISDKAEQRYVLDLKGNADKVLEKALDRFLCTDQAGAVFCGSINGRDSCYKPKQIRLVALDDLKSRKNKLRQNQKGFIRIFSTPNPDALDYPSLHFSRDFVKRLERSGNLTLEHIISKMERQEIYPVCPFCTSDLPRRLLSQKEPARVVKLGLIGPAGSGKTSLNVINILFKCLNCGGWSVNIENLYKNSHYLLTDNYYKTILESWKPPSPTPDSYIPPLLLQLERGGQCVLLSLLDIPSKRLQTIRKDILSHPLTRQTEYYIELFRQMDGWLLMLDSEREVLPKINNGQHGGAAKSPETLMSLLQIFSRLPEWQRKPAALVMTKCDQIFKDFLKEEKNRELFATFSPIERKLWQQLWNLEQPEKEIVYSADRHEIIQYSFKPLIQRHFPELTDELNRYFSPIDIFPESNWGYPSVAFNFQEKRLDDSKVKPFYSADPIFWLLDIIQ